MYSRMTIQTKSSNFIRVKIKEFNYNLTAAACGSSIENFILSRCLSNKPQASYPNISTKTLYQEIKIHPKIERSPTDILKALNSTVGTDFTAPHYRYHDDPYLIPVNNLTKRTYALSKEAGRKAARWIRQEHGDLFDHRHAQPPIEAFYPTPVVTDDSPVDEKVLNYNIEHGHLTDAIKVYMRLLDAGTEISESSKESLLELLAYYNEIEPIDEEWTEERWYRQGVVGRDRVKNTWKDNGLAEKIFKELIEKDPMNSRAYSAIIRGCAKHFQADRAWTLFNQAQENKVMLNIEVYNSLIRIANLLKENSDMRWQLIQDLLYHMKDAKLAPNLNTMNSVLESASQIGNARLSKQICLGTFAEFKKLGIEPSLASFYYLIISHCKERGPTCTILVDILKELEGKTFTVKDEKDTFFFVTAMDNCKNHLQDLELAEKVNKLLHIGDNYDLIGDSYKESIYYRHYLGLKVEQETFDEFMKVYNKLVPNIYTPEPRVIEEILKGLEINEAYDYLPQIWSDIIIFDQTHRENLISLILGIMSSYALKGETKHLEVFGSISWKIWEILEKLNEDEGKLRKVSWTGDMLGDLMTCLLKTEEGSRSYLILRKLIEAPQEVLGVPKIQSLQMLLDYAIKEKNAPVALVCVQYVSEAGYAELVEMAEKVQKSLELDLSQIGRLNNIVGHDLTSIKKRSIESPESRDLAQ